MAQKKYTDGSGVAEIWANTKNYIAAQLLGKSDVGHTHNASEITSGLSTVATSGDYDDLSNKPTIPSKTSQLTNDSGYITSSGSCNYANSAGSVAWSNVSGKPSFATVATSGSYNDLTDKPTIPVIYGANSIPFHNSYPRCKYLGTSITDDQNTAIKNRTYNDLFIGDYWTINGINWRIVAIDYYYNIGDTNNFDKGNIIVMPDTVLYNAQMSNTTDRNAYAGSSMRTQNLNSARTIAQNAFGSHLANHRIMMASSVNSLGTSGWAWYDSDGVELPNEVQIYGTRVWGSDRGANTATQKQQFPLLALAPQFVNTRLDYWLQDYSNSNYFASVSYAGPADSRLATSSNGVRPSVTLSFI